MNGKHLCLMILNDCYRSGLYFIEPAAFRGQCPTLRVSAAHVVDFACGTGLVTFLAETQVGPTGYVGRRQYQRGDAGGDGTGQFDSITYAAVLVLLPDPLAAIRRWASLLREGGRLVMDMAARDVHVPCADL
jgi:SAM-dependent methyltransferase